MEIKVNLNKNFVAAINRMEKKYGADFMRLNGFGNSNLNFSEFIDRFTADNKQLVDISINPSANMAQKDVVTMISSMNEPHQKLLAYNKLYYEITKEYVEKKNVELSKKLNEYGITGKRLIFYVSQDLKNNENVNNAPKKDNTNIDELAGNLANLGINVNIE